MPSNIRVTNGEIGEAIIAEHFKDATRTDNWYDSEKDGSIGNETYEVKTIRLNNKFQGFLIDPSQYKKVDGVYHLFVVMVPEEISEGIKVYRYENHTTDYRHITLPSGKMFRCYSINNCKLLFTLYDERVNIIYENSVTMSKHKRYA